MWKRSRYPEGSITFVVLLSVLALMLFGKLAFGGWGTNGCPSVGGPVFASSPLTWHYPDDWEDTGRAQLYRGNNLVGTYSYVTGQYNPADGSASYRPEGWPVWLTAKDGCKCKKCDGKCSCGKGKCCGDKGCKCCSQEEFFVQAEQNFGLELDRIGTSGKPRYTLHDGPFIRELTHEETKRLLAKGLSDDSNKPYLVAVCTDSALREKVFMDIYSNPAFAWLRDNARLQVYGDPKHYQLEAFKLDRDERFQKSGLMFAVVQAPNAEGIGKRLYAQYDYEGGPERLSTEARRRVDPNFDPNKAPTKPDATPNVSTWVLIGQLFAALPGWSYVLASLGVALLILRGAK